MSECFSQRDSERLKQSFAALFLTIDTRYFSDPAYPPPGMNLVMAIFFGICTFYGGVLIYGLKRKWHWVTDPPEWLFAFYFPATVKILCGPKAVSAAAYITAWGHFVIGVVCLIPPLVDLILSWL